LATKDYGASLFRGFTVNGKDVAAGSAPLQALQDAVSALAPIAQGAAVTIAAIYVAPSGQPGDHVATTLAAHASAGGISQPPPALPPPGKVDNVLGAFTDILTTLAEQLYAQYRQPTPAETVSALLTQADADLKAFVNGPTGVIVTSSDLARTLAIHDLADDLYGRLINAHRQPAQLDTVPSIN
jgi:hypothetical protein